MEIVKVPSKSKNINKRLNPYGSNDSFTQAKYLYDLQMQIGNPISFAEAYEEAVSIAKENAEDMKRLGIR